VKKLGLASETEVNLFSLFAKTNTLVKQCITIFTEAKWFFWFTLSGGDHITRTTSFIFIATENLSRHVVADSAKERDSDIFWKFSQGFYYGPFLWSKGLTPQTTLLVLRGFLLFLWLSEAPNFSD